MKKRRNRSPDFKAKVGLEALKGQQTTADLARRFEVQASQITLWKRAVKEGLGGLFESPGGEDAQQREEEIARLQAKIGELTMELDWLKKNPHTGPCRRSQWLGRDRERRTQHWQTVSVVGGSSRKCLPLTAGQWTDNVFIERLWRSYKYEDGYLSSYADGFELRDGADRWFDKSIVVGRIKRWAGAPA